MILKTIDQQAKEMVQNLPSPCTTAELGKVMGCHPASVRRWIKSSKVQVLRTSGRHRRIPRDVQERFVAESLRRGRE